MRYNIVDIIRLSKFVKLKIMILNALLLHKKVDANEF